MGLLLTSSYQRNIQLPEGTTPEDALRIVTSIGKIMVAAQALESPAHQSLIAAGRLAFSTSHIMELLAATDRRLTLKNWYGHCARSCEGADT
ncbi:hypothetical protein [Ottowia thiooxydans]|uniref:hypothetical protein n=1 Tax=Ottowia thiooxydans TaxID=219182 RepID=UPI003391248F